MTEPKIVARTHRRRAVTVWSFRVLLVTFVLLVFTQAVLAGGFLSGEGSLRAVHRRIGDEILPWVAAVQVLLATMVWRPGRGPWWPALASLVLFVAVIAQLSLGFTGRVDLHVPLGVAIFGGAIWLLDAARGLSTKKDEPA